MKDLQKELLADAQRIMLTSEGSADLELGDIEVLANAIIATVIGGPWAVMDEFGTGSWMDRNNPALEAYRKSGMWNPARDDAKIRSRPDVPGQRNIFGESVNGRGKGGVDLEALGIVEAQVPSHALENAAKWMRQSRFRDRIRQVLAAFPFGRFFITNKK